MIRWKVEPWIDRAPTHSRYMISTLFGGKVTIFSLNKSKHLNSKHLLCIPRNPETYLVVFQEAIFHFGALGASCTVAAGAKVLSPFGKTFTEMSRFHIKPGFLHGVC